MRVIGHLNGESAARLFVDYLYVKGVDSEMEWESGDRWEIWVHAEEQFAFARQLLGEFAANPGAPQFAAVGRQAEAMRRKAAEREAHYRKRVKTRAETVAELGMPRMGKLTVGLIGVCVGVFLLMQLSEAAEEKIFYWLKISNHSPSKGSIGLSEVLSGQVWRLVTPILMHANFVHIFFNLWWMKDLGSILEWKFGWRALLILVVGIAAGSNLAQYYVGGSGNFLGISGVVFGLLGFVWVRGKFDPNFGFQLPPAIVFLMLLWLVLGYTGVLASHFHIHLANTAHSAGLAIGVLSAFLPWHTGR